jgi:hypothetical protein
MQAYESDERVQQAQSRLDGIANELKTDLDKLRNP